jgi:hypothetical protein
LKDFDVYVDSWKSDASRLLDEGLEYLQQLDCIPVPDGVFRDFVNRLVGLPFTDKQLSRIIALIEKQSPYLQECGIELAKAFLRDVGEDPKIGLVMCKLLARKNLDPWVFIAIVEYVQLYSESLDCPANIKLFRDLAKAAYEREYIKPKPFTGNIMRNRAIFPEMDARKLLEQVLIRNTHPSRTKAILPYLEKVYKTKGLSDTVNTIQVKMRSHQ